MALINCPECGKEISDKAKSCPNCGYELPILEQGVYCPRCLYSSAKIDDDDYDTCPYCHIKFKDSIYGTFDEVYHYGENHPELKQSPEYSEKAYQERINYVPYEYGRTNSIKCPTCNSINVSRIGTGERVASVGMFGLFSKKINKTFKCNNCGYTW